MLPQTATCIHAFRHPISARHTARAQSRARHEIDNRSRLAEAMGMMGAAMSFPRKSEIFGESEPAHYAYRVVSGSVLTYKMLNDGRRQIGGFYLPTDIFDLDFSEEHAFSAEAITDTKLVVVKRSALTALAGRDAAIGREMLALTGRELRRVQDRVLLLIKTAEQRVASFLLEMAERTRGGHIIELPMSRRDIADYLGLTLETVSRILTSLAGTAAIELVTSRRIVLRNRSALKLLNA